MSGAESIHRASHSTEGLPETRTEEHKPLVDRWVEPVSKMPDELASSLHFRRKADI